MTSFPTLMWTPAAQAGEGGRCSARHPMLAAVYWSMAWLWAGLVVYGSLMPFQFVLLEPLHGPGDAAWWALVKLTHLRWITGPATQYSSLGNSGLVTDVATNVAMYLPLGLLLRLRSRQRGAGWWGQVLPAAATASALSWLMEATQGVTLGRVGSLHDWLVNTLGALAGALLAMRLERLGRAGAFATYQRVVVAIHLARDQWRRWSQARTATMAVLAGLLLAWCCWTAHGRGEGAVLLPFAAAFARSYDVAALMLLRDGVEAMVLALLSVVALRAAHQRPTVIAASLLAVSVTLWRDAVTRWLWRSTVDVTEPVLAALAATALIVGVWLARTAVRRSCRRRQVVPVSIDRRRRPHPYDRPMPRDPLR